jgi:hypothetical protein
VQPQTAARIPLNLDLALQVNAIQVITVINTLIGQLLMEHMVLSMDWHLTVMLYTDHTTRMVNCGHVTMLMFVMVSFSMMVLMDTLQQHSIPTLLGAGVQDLQLTITQAVQQHPVVTAPSKYFFNQQ